MANEKLQANYVDEPHVATPGNPDAGYTRTYRKSDGIKYKKSSAGVESAEGGGTIGGTSGAADNRIIRADGTGGSTIQGSIPAIDDSGYFSLGNFVIGDGTYFNKLALGASTNVTLSSDTLSSTNSRNFVVSAQTGSSDDLATITITGGITWESVFLRAASGHTITVKHGTGNIFLHQNADVTLDELNLLQLRYNGTNWVQDYDAGGGGTVDLTTDVTGVLPIANGGTNGNTATAGFDNLAPTTSKGDLIAHDGTDNVRVAAGADGTGIRARAGAANGIEYAGSIFAIVAPTELGSSQTTITFSSIPAYYQDLIIVVKGRGTSTGSQINITFNADTGNNYSTNRTIYNDSATATNAVVNNGALIACPNAASTSAASSGYFGHLEVAITAYAESAISRTGHWTATRFESATNIQRSLGTIAWENVANAISSIELNLNIGDFDTGTIYALYGRGTAS